METISLLTSTTLGYTSTVEDVENYIKQNFEYDRKDQNNKSYICFKKDNFKMNFCIPHEQLRLINLVKLTNIAINSFNKYKKKET